MIDRDDPEGQNAQKDCSFNVISTVLSSVSSPSDKVDKSLFAKNHTCEFHDNSLDIRPSSRVTEILNCAILNADEKLIVVTRTTGLGKGIIIQREIFDS